MQLAKIERWYELDNPCADALSRRLAHLRRSLESQGGSIVAIHGDPPASTVKVLCEVPVAAGLQRL